MEQAKWCPRCKGERPISEFYVNIARSDGLSPLCITHHRQAEKESARKRRKAFVEALGGKCEICGFADYRALQVDHVNSDGAIDRIENPNTTTKKFQEKVFSNREQYALLCANCNVIKKLEKDEYVGRRIYKRTIPQVKLQGIGRGNSPEQHEALRQENQRRKQATHCKRGHELSGHNLIVRGDGTRKCRICHYEAVERYRQRKI